MARTKEESVEYMRVWRKENRDKLKKYYLTNLESERLRKQEYYKSNKDKVKLRGEKYRAENAEKETKRHADYHKANSLKVNARVAKYRTANIEKIKIRSTNACENLKDYYVVQNLKSMGLKAEQITPELIELKRITIKTKRLCRQLKA